MTILNKSYCMLKGISGTGKGTRTWQLQDYLHTRYSSEVITMRVNVQELKSEKDRIMHLKSFILGTYFPDLNILFTGKLVKSNRSKLISWNSMDYLRGVTRSDQDLLDILTFINHMNVIIEGYPITITTNYQVPKLQSRMGYNDYYFHYFIYRTVEDLQERVIQRSGSRIKGTCWNMQPPTVSDFKKHQAMLEAGDISNIQANLKLKISYFDEPHHLFGMEYLDFIGLSHLKDDYESYVSEHSVHRNISNLKENWVRWGESLESQDDFQKKLRRGEIPTTYTLDVI